MGLVPWGDDTGEYYIIISNLPFKASWQRLKDFIRYPNTGSTIDVHHVHIYSGSTDGWVLVHGKEEALKAYEWMKQPTAVFEGRSLTVDFRNYWGPVNLRDVAPIQTPAQQEHYAHRDEDASPSMGSSQHNNAGSLVPYQAVASPTQDVGAFVTPDNEADNLQWMGQMVSHGGNYSPVSPVFSTGPHMLQTSFANPQVNYCSMPPQHIGYMATPPATPTYTQAVPIAYACYLPVAQVIPAQHIPVQPQYQYQTMVPETPHIVHTEARKIIITHLSHSTTEKELQSLLERASRRSKSSSNNHREDYPIESFEIPRHSDGKAKGHAFAIFSSSHIAKRAVDALHGRTFQRRELKARLTKEGAESTGHPSPTQEQEMCSGPPPMPPQTYESRLEPVDVEIQMGQMDLNGGTVDETRKEKREKGRSRTHDNSADTERRSKSKTSSSARAPMVVDGTGSRRHR
ncbi:hypothetical protein EG329_005595 [Mollisiaceae sp. DMI_Dod_QoI]|nr:hypothetical protein EG329_005595 [Helotiales sp. DMI_Dod_QoI]